VKELTFPVSVRIHWIWRGLLNPEAYGISYKSARGSSCEEKAQ